MRPAAIVAVLVLMVCPFAYAQDDDSSDDDVTDDDTGDDDTGTDVIGFFGRVEFNSPQELDADTTYDFEFSVENATSQAVEGDQWVYLVEIFMPGEGYDLDSDLFVPDALHGGEWSAERMDDVQANPGIQWQHSVETSSASYGDIREGESLAFAFRAHTDDEATDGFDWRLVSGSGEFDTGTAFINPPVPADDDTDDDLDDDIAPPPDTDDDAADDDDDDSGGCGC